MGPIATVLALKLAIFTPGILHGAGIRPIDLITNGGFEEHDQPVIGHSIPGWTTHGAASSAIAVVPGAAPGETAAMRIARGKAFCYGLAIEPKSDYVLSLRTKADGARSRIDIQPPPNESPLWSGEEETDRKSVV